MKDKNKRINELRDLGYGYKRIAKELSITPSAVRHACNKIEEESILKGFCKNCDKEMLSIKGKRKSSSVQTNAGGNGGMSKEKDQVTMNRSNLEMYYFSISPISSMFKEGILSKSEYLKAEAFLAEKYCIKKGNLYRLNDLTNLSK